MYPRGKDDHRFVAPTSALLWWGPRLGSPPYVGEMPRLQIPGEFRITTDSMHAVLAILALYALASMQAPTQVVIVLVLVGIPLLFPVLNWLVRRWNALVAPPDPVSTTATSSPETSTQDLGETLYQRFLELEQDSLLLEEILILLGGGHAGVPVERDDVFDVLLKIETRRERWRARAAAANVLLGRIAKELNDVRELVGAETGESTLAALQRRRDACVDEMLQDDAVHVHVHARADEATLDTIVHAILGPCGAPASAKEQTSSPGGDVTSDILHAWKVIQAGPDYHDPIRACQRAVAVQLAADHAVTVPPGVPFGREYLDGIATIASSLRLNQLAPTAGGRDQVLVLDPQFLNRARLALALAAGDILAVVDHVCNELVLVVERLSAQGNWDQVTTLKSVCSYLDAIVAPCTVAATAPAKEDSHAADQG